MNTVLFLCTGNYYRSRFAEELFNFRASADCPEWRAISRGVAVDLGHKNVGPMAQATARALRARGIDVELERARKPLQLEVADLDAASHVVALKRAEHRPLLFERFPAWSAERASRVEFWRVHDVDCMAPEEALPIIEREVMSLMRRLAEGCGKFGELELRA